MTESGVEARPRTVQMHVYLNFRGQCEAAFEFYAKCFDGTLGPLFRYAGSPFSHQVPPDWQDKVMHASVMIGDQMLQGADVAPGNYEQPQGFSLSLQMTEPEKAARLFGLLSTDGTVVMPLEKTFWATRFGVVVDQFGIRWQINCE